jgi:abortive infection bacteriophage resistance protein
VLKKPATYKEQIEKLREYGFIINDEAFCEDVLSRISYYRLSAYFLTFKQDDGTYTPETSFNQIYNLHEFDRKLRRLLFSTLEELEIYIRAQLSYQHTHNYGAGGYKNPLNFNKRHSHSDFKTRLKDLIKTSNKLSFVNHHINKYSGNFPLWVIMELFTFGMLSYFYAEMLTPDQKYLAHNIFKASVTETKSWLYCCTNLRNMCAHSQRLYNSAFSVVPANIPQVDPQSQRKLFAAVMALQRLYPSVNKWNNDFIPAISNLIDEYSDNIVLQYIGFPDDWEVSMKK